MTTPAAPGTSTPATTPRKGLKSGLMSELAAFFTVRPGHEQQLKDELTKRFPTAENPVPKIPVENLMRVGNHHVKHYLFDNDQRLIVALSFDGTWDKYFDDAIGAVGVDNFYSWLQHCNEIPEGLPNMSIAQVKEALSNAQVQAFTYVEVIPDMTIQQIAKAQRLMTAFQQVLDNPDAAQALQHPVLKPLLDEAAD